MLSCHGDSEGVIIDSTGEEVSLEILFAQYDGAEFSYLAEKPKIIFADACRGEMRGNPIETVKFKDTILPKGDNATNHNQNGLKSKVSSLTIAKSLQLSNVKKNLTTQKHLSNLAATVEFDQDSKSIENQDMQEEYKFNISNNWYHPKANFMFVYPNPEGYAAADGGIKGGYLIRSIKSVFSNLEISTKQSLNEIIRQIRSQTKIKAGKGTLECVEVVERMTYKVNLKKDAEI